MKASNGAISTSRRYMNSIQKGRAMECRKLYINLHHPNDKVLGDGLNNGCYPNAKLTSQDLRNSNELLGGCEPCVETKMKAPAEQEPTKYHDDTIEATLYCDWVPILL